MNREWKRDPYVAEVRAGLCKSYRAIRKDNPAMARLLFKRAQLAQEQFSDWLFSSYATSSSSLADLLLDK